MLEAGPSQVQCRLSQRLNLKQGAGRGDIPLFNSKEKRTSSSGESELGTCVRSPLARQQADEEL